MASYFLFQLDGPTQPLSKKLQVKRLTKEPHILKDARVRVRTQQSMKNKNEEDPPC